MKLLPRTLALLGTCLLPMSGAAASQGTSPVPTYANVTIVSVDLVRRLVVIQNSSDARETLEMDDLVAGTDGVKPGDRVMLTVRNEPGRRRVSAMTRLSPTATSVRSPEPPLPAPASTDAAHREARARFDELVSTAAQQAQRVDARWSELVASCDAKASPSVEKAHPWLGLWDGRADADLSKSFCRDLYNQILSSGESVKQSMASAEDVARKQLAPGEIREVRKAHALDWDGWTLPPPEKRAP